MELGMSKKYWYSETHNSSAPKITADLYHIQVIREKNSEELELCLQKIKTQYRNKPAHLDMNKPNSKKSPVDKSVLAKIIESPSRWSQSLWSLLSHLPHHLHHFQHPCPGLL